MADASGPQGWTLPNTLSVKLASLPQHLLSGAKLLLSARPVEHGKLSTGDRDSTMVDGKKMTEQGAMSTPGDKAAQDRDRDFQSEPWSLTHRALGYDHDG
jgi:hypothetical protein